MKRVYIKRAAAVLLAGALVFSAAGCGKKKPAEPETIPSSTITPESTESVERTESAESVPESESIPVDELESHGEGLPESESSAAEVPVEGKVIEEDFYTVTIPKEIEDKVTVNTGYGQEVTVYDTESMEAGMGGFIVSIGTYLHPADFIMLPSYEYLGKLHTPEAEFYVAAYYPTDVQSDPDHMSGYQDIAAQTETLIGTLTAKEGNTFEKGTLQDIAYEIRRFEYANSIAIAYQLGALPDGTTADGFDPMSETGQFAIQDINDDGAEDLLLSMGSGYAYTYDVESGSYKELEEDPLLLSSVMWMEMNDANLDSVFAALYGA